MTGQKGVYFYSINNNNNNNNKFIIIIIDIIIIRGRRVIGISGSLIWSKALMELIFKPCGEFQ